MPRQILSTVGGRALTIDDAADNFSTWTAAPLPDGSLGVLHTPGASPFLSYMYDRGAPEKYQITPGQPKTINVWCRFPTGGGTGVQTHEFMGYGYQDSASTSGNWSLQTSGNGMSVNLRTAVGGASVAAAAPAGGFVQTFTDVWEMITIVYNPTGGSGFGTLTLYVKGIAGTTASPSAAWTPTEPLEFWMFGKANYALTLHTTADASLGFAKLSTFDKALTGAEIAGLYQAMQNS